MKTLLAGGSSGVTRIEDGKAIREDGPAAVASFARASDGIYAVTPEAAVWRREAAGKWQLVNERAVEDEVWSFAADPRIEGRLYIGVSPALLYRSEDGGKRWTRCDSVKSIPGYETWTFPPPPHIPHIRSIAADPRTPGAVFIGVEEGGI